jgi:hypothetical protein
VTTPDATAEPNPGQLNEDEVLAPSTPGAQALPTTGADDVEAEGEAD